MGKATGKQLARGNIRCKTPLIANTGANKLARCSEKLGPHQSHFPLCQGAKKWQKGEKSGHGEDEGQ